MVAFLISNLGTILVGLVVFCVLLLVILKLRKDRKQGKTSCGMGCTGCPNAGNCHKKY